MTAPLSTPPLSMPPLSGVAATPSGVPTSATTREQLGAAAKQFEAIFVRQMLSASRKADFGDSLFGGQGMDTFRQMQDEKFADIASQTGALGMAKMIEAHLAKMLPAGAAAPAGTAKGGVTDGL